MPASLYTYGTGIGEGTTVGTELKGTDGAGDIKEGTTDGTSERKELGVKEGVNNGTAEGPMDDTKDGSNVGSAVGSKEGTAEGS